MDCMREAGCWLDEGNMKQLRRCWGQTAYLTGFQGVHGTVGSIGGSHFGDVDGDGVGVGIGMKHVRGLMQVQ